MIPFDTQINLGSPNLLSRIDLIRVVLRLQSDGWNRAKEMFADLSPSKNEVYLNGCLFRGMDASRRALKLYNLQLLEKPAVRSDSGLITPDKEPDFGVFFIGFSASYPHALIEGKRLDPSDRSRKLRGEYIRNGVDRFVDGSYGRDHELDFMVAYVIYGDSSAAMVDINTYLAKVRRTDESMFRDMRFIRSGFVARSEHTQATPVSQFVLLHSFLEFD